MVSIIVTGAVAVGKSFIINLITEWFGEESIYLLPEFIHDDVIGQKLLKKCFKEDISSLTLQSYVMDKWLYNIKKSLNKASADKIKLYERLPIDAYEIFSNSLSTSGKECLCEVLSKIDKIGYSDYTFPPEETLWIRYHNSLTKDNSSNLKALLNANIKSKSYIVIEITSETPFQNYLRRARRGEVYSEETIKGIYNEYENFLSDKRKHYESSMITIY